MPTDTVSIDQFIHDNRITMSYEQADSNPSMPEAHASGMDHWKCTLIRTITVTQQTQIGADSFENKTCTFTRRMTLVFSMGSGHNGRPPEPRDVLSCLASDASSAGMTFE